MRIVLTNDDGFGSVGIEALREVLQEYGEVFVFAPALPQSGMSCAFTTYSKPIRVEGVDEHSFKVEGTPVDCVLLANAYLKGDYDMIVSGCNNGFNVSNDIMYSGTCGACQQGLVFRKKCVAFSSGRFETGDRVKKYVSQTLRYLFDKELFSDEYYLNVNLHADGTDFKGIRLTKLYLRILSKYTLAKTDEQRYKVTHVHDDDVYDNDDYDVSAVHNGYVSVTPVSLTCFKEEFFNKVKTKI